MSTIKTSSRSLNLGLCKNKTSIDQSINPLGLNVNFNLVSEQNDFIDELDLSDAGTLTSKFNKHNLFV
ncbi:MAG: hypothetical protein Ct9H90mP7_0140 [Candidatus Neomarinimicrobiota bacterium]|nr:MAG: hypothetical protein Ct9H90mP7_0140 [Candidatus Neomarinimicrobiota bacterium]